MKIVLVLMMLVAAPLYAAAPNVTYALGGDGTVTATLHFQSSPCSAFMLPTSTFTRLSSSAYTSRRRA